MKKFDCPQCGKEIPFRERTKYVNQLTLSRKVLPCIYCGTSIGYLIAPLTMLRIFIILLLSSMAADVVLGGIYHPFFQYIILIALLMLFASIFFLRFEVVRDPGKI